MMMMMMMMMMMISYIVQSNIIINDPNTTFRYHLTSMTVVLTVNG